MKHRQGIGRHRNNFETELTSLQKPAIGFIKYTIVRTIRAHREMCLRGGFTIKNKHFKGSGRHRNNFETELAETRYRFYKVHD
jgi:hypothetical protein